MVNGGAVYNFFSNEFATNVTQIPAFSQNTNYFTNQKPTGNSYYYTYGKLCVVNIVVNCVASNNAVTYVGITLPKPYGGKMISGSCVLQSTSNNMVFGVMNDGRLFFRGRTAGERYYGSIGYII